MEILLDFRKHAFGASRRRLNAVEVEIRLKEGNCLSIVGHVWNAKHTDIIMGGQCQDSIRHIIGEKLYNIWEDWHLNDFHPGTEKQESYLAKHNNGKIPEYKKACKILKAANLYVDEGYAYGSSWLKRELPQYVMEFLNILKYRPLYECIEALGVEKLIAITVMDNR